MLDTVTLELGFAGGIIYLAADFSLTRGWVSGTSYGFHSTSVFICITIAASSAYSQAWLSAVMNVIFIIVGAVFMAKKAIDDRRSYPVAVVDAPDLTYQSDEPELTVVV